MDFGLKTPWDLDKLEPNNFFPVPACVVFAEMKGKVSGAGERRKRTAKPLAPGRVEIWRGPTGTDEVTRQAEALHHDDGSFHSPYAELSMQGPTVVDRRLFLVTTAPNDGRLPMPGTRKTAPRLGGNDKKKYSVAALNDFVVREDNLFDLYLGESVAPYVALRPVTAALPVSKATMTMPLDCSRCPPNSKTGTVKHDFCAVNVPALAPGMRERWPIMESLWDANKSRNDDKPLIKNLNWLNKLTSQLAWLRDHGDRPVRIAYTTSGRPTAALIADNRAILDTSTYQVSCRDDDEAHYLAGDHQQRPSVHSGRAVDAQRSVWRGAHVAQAHLETPHPGV